MGGMQRRKGAIGEREVVQVMLRHGILCRRTVQYCGKPGSAADVVCEGLDLHIEVKRVENLSWKRAIAQASHDAHGQPWIILHRVNGGEWMVIQTLENWVQDSTQAKRAQAFRRAMVETVDAPEAL